MVAEQVIAEVRSTFDEYLVDGWMLCIDLYRCLHGIDEADLMWVNIVGNSLYAVYLYQASLGVEFAIYCRNSTSRTEKVPNSSPYHFTYSLLGLSFYGVCTVPSWPLAPIDGLQTLQGSS